MHNGMMAVLLCVLAPCIAMEILILLLMGILAVDVVRLVSLNAAHDSFDLNVNSGCGLVDDALGLKVSCAFRQALGRLFGACGMLMGRCFEGPIWLDSIFVTVLVVLMFGKNVRMTVVYWLVQVFSVHGCLASSSRMMGALAVSIVLISLRRVFGRCRLLML